MGVLIDTTLLVDLERGHDQIDELVGDEERAISVVTVSELLVGVHRAPPAKRPERHALVEYTLALFDAVPISEPIARIHADAAATMRARGETMGTHDLWIAATALAHGFGVATRDADFARVTGLRVLLAT